MGLDQVISENFKPLKRVLSDSRETVSLTIFFKLAGLPVFYSGLNESSLAPQFQWLDNIFNLFSSDGRAQRTSYLGGTDEDAESAWMWLDGTPWEYTHWREGEPNGDRGENCLLLDLDVGSHGEWIDIDCAGRGGREEGYICSYVNGKFIGFFLQCIAGKVGNKADSNKILDFTALIKKKIKFFSNIRKFRRERLLSHI